MKTTPWPVASVPLHFFVRRRDVGRVRDHAPAGGDSGEVVMELDLEGIGLAAE
jgi:hypothetical protein